MAEQRRFQFDSDTRSVDVPSGRRRVSWLWIAISLAVHGAIVLFVLAGAARGGHTELLGTLDVTIVGAPSAGDPESSAKESAEAKPTDAAARPNAPPVPPQPETLTQPADAKPAEAAPPPPPKSASAPPPSDAVPPPQRTATLPSPSAPAQPAHPSPPTPPRQQAAIPEAPTNPPSPEGIAKPVAPKAPTDPKATPVEVVPPPTQPARPESAAAPDAPKTAPSATDPKAPAEPAKEAVPSERPVLPETKTALAAPPRPKAAPNAKATPTAAKSAPATKPTEKATAEKPAAKQGVKRAAEGQTASLGAPTGGERLGRSENDDTNGVLNVNMNPRFRQPPAPPRYPRQSVERDEEGVVMVRAFVDPAGAPQRVVVFRTSGFPLLDEAALKAVQGWRFEPMVREGRATAAWVQVPVRFRLN
jgi:protein TonB